MKKFNQVQPVTPAKIGSKVELQFADVLLRVSDRIDPALGNLLSMMKRQAPNNIILK